MSGRKQARITNLDTSRGVAVLGILLMNAVSIGLGTAPYFNLDAGGSDTWLDWIIGAFGEIFVDQKFMGLFSLLFGVGIVLFADRAAKKGERPIRLSLFRNALLLGIGLLHGLLWEGDVLVVYALCAPVLIALRNRQPPTLFVLGGAILLFSPLAALIAQDSVGSAGEGLGEYWLPSGAISDTVGLFLYIDFFSRALGLMLIGVALYRNGFVTGELSAAAYRRVAGWGLGLGFPLSILGFVWVASNDFGPEVAVVGSIPNTVATIPIVLGYASLLTLWNRRPERAAHRRLRAVGRMALTNYLMQTVLAVIVLRTLVDATDLTRSMIFGFVVIVWALQLWWSPRWLARFSHGPFEWLWRKATYLKWRSVRGGVRASASA